LPPARAQQQQNTKNCGILKRRTISAEEAKEILLVHLRLDFVERTNPVEKKDEHELDKSKGVLARRYN
jgi:hypothetical protein